MGIDRRRTLRGALAGGAAAAMWALQQPLDKRAFRFGYDDTELLGRFVTGERDGWRAPGLALHLGNGALFGALYAQIAPRLPGPPAARGAAVGLAEHLGSWPFTALTDRFHPARAVLPALTGSRRAFWQAAWRHALFGAVLGELEARVNAPAAPAPEPPPGPSPLEGYVSSNGHGRIEHAAASEPQG